MQPPRTWHAPSLPRGRSALGGLTGFGRLVLGTGDTVTAPGAPYTAFGPGACGVPHHVGRTWHAPSLPRGRSALRGLTGFGRLVLGTGDTVTAPGAPYTAFRPRCLRRAAPRRQDLARS